MSFQQKRMERELREKTGLGGKEARKLLQKSRWNLRSVLRDMGFVETDEGGWELAAELELDEDEEEALARAGGAGNVDSVTVWLGVMWGRVVRTWSIRHTLALVLWTAGMVLFFYLDFTLVYVIVTALLGIFLNLGTRQPGTKSAYSVFNKGCEPIAGPAQTGTSDLGLLAMQGM